jgi:Zn-dependent protease
VAEGQPHFTIAGIPIRIEWSFWLIAVFLGYGARTGWLLVAWVGIVLVSILVHELGHAVALRIYHQRPRVVLHAFGGLTYGSAAYRSRTQSIVVSAAGPLTALLLLGLPAYAYFQTFDVFDQFFDHDKYVIVQDIAWVNIAWSIVNLLPILPLDGGNIAAALFGSRTARLISMVVAFAAAVYFFEQQNQFAGFFLMMFAIMNFASYQQEKGGQSPSVPTVPTPAARRVTLQVPRPAGPTGDLFLQGSRALAEGRTAEGLDALASAYAARPTGPSNLLPAQQLARAGQATALATRLLGPRGAGANAASNLQSHLHYADCFRESAEVGALVYADGRVSRAQTAYEIACAAARTGDNEQAMAWLGRSIDDGFRAGALLDGEPDLAPLRIHPGWPAIRARVT